MSVQWKGVGLYGGEDTWIILFGLKPKTEGVMDDESGDVVGNDSKGD